MDLWDVKKSPSQTIGSILKIKPLFSCNSQHSNMSFTKMPSSWMADSQPGCEQPARHFHRTFSNVSCFHLSEIRVTLLNILCRVNQILWKLQTPATMSGFSSRFLLNQWAENRFFHKVLFINFINPYTRGLRNIMNLELNLFLFWILKTYG